jgi:hypothetical protein
MSSFVEALLADGTVADLGEKMQLYGQFVGDWESTIIAHAPDGTTHEGRGEIHFAWVLDGRAIQDVWRITQPQSMPLIGNWYGTTLRIYDSQKDAWHIFWMDPGRHFLARQVGCARGNDIEQEGHDDNGAHRRWRFTEITKSAFHWIGEMSPDSGTTWIHQVDVFARRR